MNIHLAGPGRHVHSWASDIDDQTMAQAARTARLPVVAGRVALMPDAHLGLGATVGSVVPTEGAIIPACVGVDIGCGMAGVRIDLDPKRAKKASPQLGTLGSGNHFVELCLDENETVWLMLHSGSRGIGNQLAQSHISTAKAVAKRMEIGLADPDLAYLLAGTPEFERYVTDLLWAQDYAAQDRELMVDAVLSELFVAVGKGRERERINCHHNYSTREVHEGRELWITRKGAIRVGAGELGIIPGSMGAASYIVEGLGSSDSFESCSHGAGRRLSRTKAKKLRCGESLIEVMGDRVWLADRARKLVDEHPGAYKDLDRVMADQTDLVTIRTRLTQILNYKGC